MVIVEDGEVVDRFDDSVLDPVVTDAVVALKVDEILYMIS